MKQAPYYRAVDRRSPVRRLLELFILPALLVTDFASEKKRPGESCTRQAERDEGPASPAKPRQPLAEQTAATDTL